MKKLFLLVSLAVLLAACNSSQKPTETEQSGEVNMENLVEMTIPVHGMTCEGCENAVKQSISSLDGIAEVSASHTDSVAVVKFDETQTDVAAIKMKIADAGYTVAEKD